VLEHHGGGGIEAGAAAIGPFQIEQHFRHGGPPTAPLSSRAPTAAVAADTSGHGSEAGERLAAIPKHLPLPVSREQHLGRAGGEAANRRGEQLRMGRQLGPQRLAVLRGHRQQESKAWEAGEPGLLLHPRRPGDSGQIEHRRQIGPSTDVPGKRTSKANVRVSSSAMPGSTGFSYRVSVEGCE